MRVTRRAVIATAVGAVVLAGTVAGGAYVGGTLADQERHRQATALPSPTASSTPAVPVQPSPTPSPSSTPSPSAHTAVSAPKPLYNMRNAGIALELDVPTIGKCPRAHVQLDAQGEGKSHGHSYRIAGEATFAYGDLTGDGHEEVVLTVVCGDDHQGYLLVLEATSATAYVTRAALPSPRDVASYRISGQRLRTGNVSYPPEASTVHHVYKLSGDRLVTVS